MDDDTLFTIGPLAERTGLTVKTIRFYSDKGIVPPAAHSPTGYRLYNADAAARLELVRTLRELGIDLPTVARVLAHETSVTAVAAAQAEALDVQIRILRMRRAVLRAVAERASHREEMELMHNLMRLSEAERQRLINDFADATYGGVDANPALVELVRTSMPELPDDPTTAQITAWMELVELVQDNDFRAAVRVMAEYQARERADGDTTGLHHDLTEAVRTEVGKALADGLSADSPAAAAIIDTLTARYADTFAKPDDPRLRRWILERLDIANDPRVEHYWRLVSTINNWPEPPDMAPIFTWFATALRAHPGT
ncbi:MerR family transcriptional regulator [Nocardia yunnanensis]|uniref:MerR family transcriptional regulator n=1 Tax=Nocardia yunnanensis TaxID=2382165 RepID=A0A386ZB16_9NOCA|nr:MerR family transcriptional regulator [Nocardia yunnanensis]AYF73689.1 MerR family transcriptional regulator [Nocardia yunnanensis]